MYWSIKSKGNYIFSLDNDDIYFENDIFDFIYKQAIIEDYDIVKFEKIYMLKNNFNMNKIKKININKSINNYFILHQPKLGIYPISKNGKFKHNDYFIWDKCIKTHIYKEAINKLGKNIYSKLICWNEDVIIIFIIFNISKSFKYIKKYGIIHFISNSTASVTLSINQKIFCDIFFLYVIFKFSKNNYDKNYAIYYFLNNKRFFYKFMTKRNRLFLKSILIKIFNNQYIEKINKKILIKKIDEINQLL